MGNSVVLFPVFLLGFAISLVPASSSKSYIVYLGSNSEGLSKEKLVKSHQNLLKPVLNSAKAAQKAIIYSYTHGFNGFAAKLLAEDAKTLSQMPGVLSIFRNKKNSVHTTRSWEFMGLEREGNIPPTSLWNKSTFGRDIIIGSLDTGIWPESESFNDDGIRSIPTKWKGTCVSGAAFNVWNCNKKLIGAKYYIKGFEMENGPLNISSDFKSPRDKVGHGTHTASTAAGRFVPSANLLSFGNGTAKGGAALARISIYKVCWQNGESSDCYDADILAAMDDAIKDGVDVLTLSLGPAVPLQQLFEDGIAVGAYHAVQKGIPVICSAGNDGPLPGSVGNVAPWILTVAASTIDREFRSYIVLGDNTTYKGYSISDSKLDNGTLYSIVFGGDIPAAPAKASDSVVCSNGSLDVEKAKGKIVVCLRGGSTSSVSKGQTVRLAGGVGMVLVNSQSDEVDTSAEPDLLPSIYVAARSGAAILAYLNSTSTPTATITGATTFLPVKPAPTMAPFSSQGPNALIPEILKPDVTAPGVNILAAYTGASSPTGLPNDTRVVKFNVYSGTSMSCPHVAGIAANLKSLHPDWSPAAIKSAIMTTANAHDNREQLILASDSHLAGPFNFGSGHLNPNAAADPGLVYDLAPQDYALLLCSLKYSSQAIKPLVGQNFSCPTAVPEVSSFNYPTISISKLSYYASVTRTLTNVGDCSSTYQVFVKPPAGVVVSVSPQRLTFSGIGQKQSYTVIFSVKKASSGGYVFGYLIWSDGKHQVRSSMAVNVINQAHNIYEARQVL